MFLTAMSRFDEAETEFERARKLDPLSLITITLSAYPYYYGRRYDRAVERLQDVISMDDGYSMAHFRLGLTFAQQHDFERAIFEVKRSKELSDDRDTIAALGYVQGLAGDAVGAEATLVELDAREKGGFVSAYDRALVSMGVGDHEKAIEWLERAYDERSYWLIYLNVDPALDPLRDHARFMKLVEKVFGTN
jgi:tetratricopeptide (TPR) repeat protein